VNTFAVKRKQEKMFLLKQGFKKIFFSYVRKTWRIAKYWKSDVLELCEGLVDWG
jgi:hypothetical protein